MAELKSRVVYIGKHKTSMRLAETEWDALDYICRRENIKRNALLNMINSRKSAELGLTGSVRIFAITYYYHLLIKEPRIPAHNTADLATPVFDAIKGII